LLAPIALLGWLLSILPTGAANTETLEIVTRSGVHPFSVEVVDTDAGRQKGLMYRKQVPEGTGMLFDFKIDAPVSFWMKNTYVPLDMIFIRNDGTIASIAENTEPLSEKLVPSAGPVRGVLEVVAGTAKKLDIQPGDRVAFRVFSKK
jgi:uncharacterized membrane protein (UPF0127 family)